MIDIDLLVQVLRKRGHTVETVIPVAGKCRRI